MAKPTVGASLDLYVRTGDELRKLPQPVTVRVAQVLDDYGVSVQYKADWSSDEIAAMRTSIYILPDLITAPPVTGSYARWKP